MVADRRGIYAKPPRTVGEMKALQRFIYVIGPLDGAQKVKLAINPEGRLARLQTGCPHELVLQVAFRLLFDEALSIERRTHRLLERCYAREEWFDTTPAGDCGAQASTKPLSIVTRTPNRFQPKLSLYLR